jgi:hypothetical protein
MSMLSASRHLVLAITVVCAGCANPLNPETGMAAPKDQGRWLRGWSDQGAPLRDVRVQVHDIPNAPGFMASVKGPTPGCHDFQDSRRAARRSDAAGRLRAGPDGVVKAVDVVKDASVTVFFRLVRK